MPAVCLISKILALTRWENWGESVSSASRDSGGFHLLSSLPEDLAFKILDYLTLPDRLMASVACKSLGKLCKDGLIDIEIQAEDLDQLDGAQAWLAESAAGRQRAVRSLSFTCKNRLYRSKPFDSDYFRPHVPLALPSGRHIYLDR